MPHVFCRTSIMSWCNDWPWIKKFSAMFEYLLISSGVFNKNQNSKIINYIEHKGEEIGHSCYPLSTWGTKVSSHFNYYVSFWLNNEISPLFYCILYSSWNNQWLLPNKNLYHYFVLYISFILDPIFIIKLYFMLFWS